MYLAFLPFLSPSDFCKSTCLKVYSCDRSCPSSVTLSIKSHRPPLIKVSPGEMASLHYSVNFNQ